MPGKIVARDDGRRALDNDPIFNLPPARKALWYCRSEDMNTRLFIEEYVDASRRYTVHLILTEGLRESFKIEERGAPPITENASYPLSGNVLHGMLESTRTVYGLPKEANLIFRLKAEGGRVIAYADATLDGESFIGIGLQPAPCKYVSK